jgi:transcriptional regulator with XRE-family HTH domain
MENVVPVKSDRRMLKSILTEQRKDADISQELIAEKLNLNQSTISSYESNAEKLKSQGVHFARVFFSAYEFPNHKVEDLMRKLFGDVMALFEPLEKVTLEHSSDYLRVLDLTVSPKGGLETLENATLQIPYEASWPGELLGFVVATPDATRDTVVIIQMLKDNQKPEKGNLCLFEYRGDDNIARVQIAKLLEITGDSFVLIDFFSKSYVSKKVLGQEIEYRVIRKPKT